MLSLTFQQGKVEKGLFDIAENNKEGFEVWCVRPSGILPADAGLLQRISGKLYTAIDVDKLSAVMVKILLDGYEDRIIENSALFTI